MIQNSQLHKSAGICHKYRSELSRTVTLEKFENAFVKFIEQADKNAVSKKANGDRIPDGFSEPVECDGRFFRQRFGQGANSQSPYMNWWVVSIYYVVGSGEIIVGIEENRYPQIKEMSPLDLISVGRKKTKVAMFYKTTKHSINYIELYDRFISVCEEVMSISGLIINEDVDETIITGIETDADKLQILGKERATFIKARINQSVFRERLLKKYDCCCLCKVSNPKFLIASHIKPWANSENDEKLDADNGFLLCPNHDALFDSGYISFDENGVIMISEELGPVDAVLMNVDKNMKISLSSKNKKYLEYHRNNIFKK